MRVGAVVASAALHAVLLAWLGAVDAPAPVVPEPKPDLEGLEVTWLESVPTPAPGPRAVEPSETTETEPGPSVSPGKPRRDAGRRKGPGTGVSPDSGEDDARPGGQGLALSGFRERSRGRGQTGPPPRPSFSPEPGAPKRVRTEPRAYGPSVRDTDEPRSLEEAGFRKRKDGTYKKGKLSDPFVAIIEPNGRVRFRDRRVELSWTSVKPNLLPLQKLAGEEQFRTQKTRLLRETAALRRAMAKTWSVKQMKRELARLDTKLKVVWGQTEWTEARRRKQLFLLWDECEEPLEEEAAVASTDDELDAARRKTGAAARKAILRFIELKLPAESMHAYSPQELRALNATRASRERFEPYR